VLPDIHVLGRKPCVMVVEGRFVSACAITYYALMVPSASVAHDAVVGGVCMYTSVSVR
jgi:hypothetical protein